MQVRISRFSGVGGSRAEYPSTTNATKTRDQCKINGLIVSIRLCYMYIAINRLQVNIFEFILEDGTCDLETTHTFQRLEFIYYQ